MIEPAGEGRVALEPEPSLGARLAVKGFKAVRWGSRRLPYEWGRRISRLAGNGLYRAAPSARATVARNLARVLGQNHGSPLLDTAVREAFRSYALYWYETFHLPVMDDEDLFAHTNFRGLENIDAALAKGGGALMTLPHMGNWDAGGRFVIAKGYRLCAVAEELKPEEAFRLFLDHRRELGMEIVSLSEGKRVGEELVRILAENQMVCLVADRDLSGRGVDVELFGGRVQMPAGPAMLSLTTGAPLLPAWVYHRDEGGWEVIIHPPLEVERTESFRNDVTELTRALAAVFERGISSDPMAWHMFQDYWAPRDAPA